MTHIRNTTVAILCLSFFAALSPVYAQVESDAEPCEELVNEEMAREHRLFRSVIFGQKKAEDADTNVGEVRYDQLGNAWYKVADNEWRSVAIGFEGTTWSDSTMDGFSQIPPRKGLLETKRMMTSELVPYIGQSMRALQCRIDLICDAVRKSIEQKVSTPVDITVDAYGCIPEDRQTIVACHLSRGQREEASDRSDAELYCERIGGELLEQEAAIMKLTVEYDSAYRTMLQLAGNFDLFLQEFNAPITNSIRQMVNLVGSFNRIPCFLSSCDASPPNFSSSSASP